MKGLIVDSSRRLSCKRGDVACHPYLARRIRRGFRAIGTRMVLYLTQPAPKQSENDNGQQSDSSPKILECLSV